MTMVLPIARSSSGLARFVGRSQWCFPSQAVRCSYSTSAQPRNDRPFRMAVIGSGPAGFYTAYRIMTLIDRAKVDMYEALPVPYGLVRFGVAPDHPEVKVRLFLSHIPTRSHLTQPLASTSIWLCVSSLNDLYRIVKTNLPKLPPRQTSPSSAMSQSATPLTTQMASPSR